MATKKRYVVSQQTRDRCQVRNVSEIKLMDYTPVSMELFSYLYETPKVPCTLFLQVETEFIEFMKPEETSKELLDSIRAAMGREFAYVNLYTTTSGHEKLQELIKSVRNKKIDDVLVKDPYLDRRTLELFGDLSNASQMVVRGGITRQVNERISLAANKLVDNLMTNPVAIGTLSRMVHCDPTLYDHSASVAMIASFISLKILEKPFNKKGSELVARAGLYHDVGKTCVPSHILNKPGSFTPEEFEVMKTHTTLGHEELNKAIKQGAPIEPEVTRVALEHHERFNGEGYPHGKKGRLEEDKNGIHIMTRIVTIADVYSALLMKRVYKPAYESGQAIKIMADSYKKDYDPDIFIPFLKHIVDSLNYYTEQEKKDKGRLLVIEDGKLKLSS